jgi:hypothetical protein
VVIELAAAKGLKAEIGGVGIWPTISMPYVLKDWLAACNAAGISPLALFSQLMSTLLALIEMLIFTDVMSCAHLEFNHPLRSGCIQNSGFLADEPQISTQPRH